MRKLEREEERCAMQDPEKPVIKNTLIFIYIIYSFIIYVLLIWLLEHFTALKGIMSLVFQGLLKA